MIDPVQAVAAAYEALQASDAELRPRIVSPTLLPRALAENARLRRKLGEAEEQRDQARAEIADLRLAMEGTAAQPILTLVGERDEARERYTRLAGEVEALAAEYDSTPNGVLWRGHAVAERLRALAATDASGEPA